MGHVTVVGGCRAKAPSTGILASTLPVGSVVKLMEGGTAVEYLVVNQGIPGNSNLYDASCDGTWLLRKDCHSNRVWDSSNASTYANSDINTWLNGDFFSSLGTIEQSTIKQIRIPYCVGGGSSTIKVRDGGLSTKVFLLGGYEVGWTTSDSRYIPRDGEKLSYFNTHSRIAYLNGTATYWWLRSPSTYDFAIWCVDRTDYPRTSDASYSNSIRPALIIPSTAKFASTTLILKG